MTALRLSVSAALGIYLMLKFARGGRVPWWILDDEPVQVGPVLKPYFPRGQWPGAF